MSTGRVEQVKLKVVITPQSSQPSVMGRNIELDLEMGRDAEGNFYCHEAGDPTGTRGVGPGDNSQAAIYDFLNKHFRA